MFQVWKHLHYPSVSSYENFSQCIFGPKESFDAALWGNSRIISFGAHCCKYFLCSSDATFRYYDFLTPWCLILLPTLCYFQGFDYFYKFLLKQCYSSMNNIVTGAKKTESHYSSDVSWMSFYCVGTPSYSVKSRTVSMSSRTRTGCWEAKEPNEELWSLACVWGLAG